LNTVLTEEITLTQVIGTDSSFFGASLKLYTYEVDYGTYDGTYDIVANFFGSKSGTEATPLNHAHN
jgi:hypothetical protein